MPGEIQGQNNFGTLDPLIKSLVLAGRKKAPFGRQKAPFGRVKVPFQKWCFLQCPVTLLIKTL